MTYFEPDLFLGRCKNYRVVDHLNGYVESLRCLDYDAEEHVCTFSESRYRVMSGTSRLNQASPHPTPQPWVKP